MARTLLEHQAELLKALGHPARLRIVQLLAEAAEGVEATEVTEPTEAPEGAQMVDGAHVPEAAELAEAKDGEWQESPGEKCVCEIIPALGMEQSSVSKHLAVLRERGIVDVRREGTRMFYRLTDSRIVEILQLARGICVAQLAQAQRILTDVTQADE